MAEGKEKEGEKVRRKLEVEVELEAMRKESLNIAEWNYRLKGEATAFIRALEWVLEPPITGESDVEAEREAILKIAKDEKGEAPVPHGDFNSGYLSALEFMVRQIRARGAEKGEGEK